MTKLARLRRQLTWLRWARALGRWITAGAAATAVLVWAFAAIFALDYLFTLDIIPRLVVIGLALAGVALLASRLARAYLRQQETDLDLALVVQRDHGIRSDLIAGLQFESPQARQWGSAELERSVVEGAAQQSRTIDVFAAMPRRRSVAWGVTLQATLLAAACLIWLLPNHAFVFANRLLLGQAHYPSNTIIQRVALNGRDVFRRSGHLARPVDGELAEGQSLQIVVVAQGALPERGMLRLRSLDGKRTRDVTLELRSEDARLEQLRTARTRIREALADNRNDPVSNQWIELLSEQVGWDAPRAKTLLRGAADDRDRIQSAENELTRIIQLWPADAARVALFSGQSQRLIEPVHYQVLLGDAWTDPALLHVVPLPIVAVVWTATPPDYARGTEPPPPPSARAILVLEGTRLNLRVRSENDKPLRQVWLELRDDEGLQQVQLVSTDDGNWQLPEQSPLTQVSQEMRFSLQVTDADGLHLAEPVQGMIRLRRDRAPRATMKLVHRVVLPDARPVLECEASDDYGIGRAELLVDVERGKPMGEESTPTEPHVVTVTLPADSTGPGVVALRQPLQLSDWQLTKGDRLRVQLKVTDHRGTQPGESFTTDPVYLEISDESGVLAAISETDEQSEEQLSEIIKRELGIGESP